MKCLQFLVYFISLFSWQTKWTQLNAQMQSIALFKGQFLKANSVGVQHVERWLSQFGLLF